MNSYARWDKVNMVNHTLDRTCSTSWQHQERSLQHHSPSVSSGAQKKTPPCAGSYLLRCQAMSLDWLDVINEKNAQLASKHGIGGIFGRGEGGPPSGKSLSRYALCCIRSLSSIWMSDSSRRQNGTGVGAFSSFPSFVLIFPTPLGGKKVDISVDL